MDAAEAICLELSQQKTSNPALRSLVERAVKLFEPPKPICSCAYDSNANLFDVLSKPCGCPSTMTCRSCGYENRWPGDYHRESCRVHGWQRSRDTSVARADNVASLKGAWA